MSISRHVFRDLFRMLEEPFFRSGPPAYSGGANHFINRHSLFDGPSRPAIDVSEESDKYVVEAELPGVKKENIEVRIGDGGRSLTVEGRVTEAREGRLRNADASSEPSTSGELEVNRPDKSDSILASNDNAGEAANQISSERTFVNNTSFRRMVWLPRPVDGTNVTANLDHGILTIKVPKAEDKASVVIPIQ